MPLQALMLWCTTVFSKDAYPRCVWGGGGGGGGGGRYFGGWGVWAFSKMEIFLFTKMDIYIFFKILETHAFQIFRANGKF